MMGPIPRPDSIPESDWVDPLPMKKRILSLIRFLLVVLFQLLVGLRLDNVLRLPWALVFVPLYVWELSQLAKKWSLSRMKIVTVEDLEVALGKPFSQFSQAEKDLIGSRYSVVPNTNCPEFEAAQKLKRRARQEIVKSLFRLLFVVVLVIQLDGKKQWNWWLVFLPFWIVTLLMCYTNYQVYADVHKMAAEKDPETFGDDTKEEASPATEYGAVGGDGHATPEETQKPSLTDEQREELKAQVMASSGKLCSKTCSQGFLLAIVLLLVFKIQGAGFSAFWIISPFLFFVSARSLSSVFHGNLTFSHRPP